MSCYYLIIFIYLFLGRATPFQTQSLYLFICYCYCYNKVVQMSCAITPVHTLRIPLMAKNQPLHEWPGMVIRIAVLTEIQLFPMRTANLHTSGLPSCHNQTHLAVNQGITLQHGSQNNCWSAGVRRSESFIHSLYYITFFFFKFFKGLCVLISNALDPLFVDTQWANA